MVNISPHRKYIAELEYRKMLDRYDKECKDIGSRIETVEERENRLQREKETVEHYHISRKHYEDNLHRILERHRKCKER